MVKQIPMFEDSAGKAHRTEHDAWKADLCLWFSGTGAVNEASAKALVEHITAGGRERANELCAVMEALSNTMPSVANAAVMTFDPFANPLGMSVVK